MAQVPETKSALLGRMVSLANQIAITEGIAGRGYRVVINCGPDGGQVIPHLHMHLLGGKQLSGRMG
ncbi:MAG: HIT domain-containing protein [Dehalococcoidales bacterium]